MLPSQNHTIDPLTGEIVELFEDYYPPQAYIRHLEHQGWEEAEGVRQWDEARGVESFTDAFARSLGYLDAQDRELNERNRP